MANERLNSNSENEGQYLSGSGWQYFDEKEYERNLSRIGDEKNVTKKDEGVKMHRLLDKLFGRKSSNSLPDNEVWEKIEWYEQNFKSNPDFVESWNIPEINVLNEIKKAKDKLEEPLVFNAAAFLLTNLEIWGSPYRNLSWYENSWLWVKVLLGKTHYEHFLMDKKKCIDDIQNTSSIGRAQLQDLLATCEMDYIVNNIRWSNSKFKYFWYDNNLPLSLLPVQFANRLWQLSKWRFTRSSVKERYEKLMYNDFDTAKNDFDRLFKTSRFPWALASLGKMLSLAKNDWQKAESWKTFLVCMLSWVLDLSCEIDMKKQLYQWGKTLWFLPGMLVKNTWHSEQVVALLDDFSNWDFSKHVKSFFHKNDLLEWEMRISDLIKEVNDWWSIDVMHKFEQYSKIDFLSKNFPSDSILNQLQKSVLNFDNEDIDKRLEYQKELGNDANVTQLKEKEEKESVQEFIRKNCSEPIEWVDKIVSFTDLVKLLVKSAEDENLPEVKKSIELWNAKDKRIYELPAYKHLIEKWFILPSDVRTYYDSANREPVYHLWVDYNVKAGTEVKAMYDWKVVKSWLDGWLWHKVIIEHSMPNWTKFYSLYGHLGSENLPAVWQLVEKWMKIWEVWEAFTKDNGDWEEHLHFQIMENLDSKKWYSKIEWEWNYDVLKSFGKE